MPTTMLPSLEINSWTNQSLAELAQKIANSMSKPLILIDGSAGSGKTTLAAKLAEILDANLVSTDDISWCADPIRWDGEMLDNIIKPWINGVNVSYRPSGWKKENRPGAIEVDSGKALIIEGMGAARKELRSLASFSVWVDADPRIARERVVQRDLANGENGGTVQSVTEFADWWDSLLNPLLLEEESWKYVDVIVNGLQSDMNTGSLMIHVTDIETDKLLTNPNTLYTERLLLRPWREADAEALYRYAKSPEIGPPAGWPPHTSVENSREIIRDVLSAPETYAIILKGTEEPIGSIGLMLGDKSSLNLPEDEGEIGYWIGVPFWGKGLVPEAVREVMRYGFEKLKLCTIWCGYYESNQKSWRVQQKCAFQYHHTIKAAHCSLLDEIRTEHVTCITKEQWLAIKG